MSSTQISTVNLKPFTTYALPQHYMTIWNCNKNEFKINLLLFAIEHLSS